MLADVVPLYPLYALFFADSGIPDTEISALFAVRSVTGLLAEVPSGALSDRFPRRHVLGLGGVLQASGDAVRLALPGFAGFVAGLVLWGIGTSLFSGTVEALVFEGLSEAGVPELYPTVRGRITAAGHLTQLPSAAAATVGPGYLATLRVGVAEAAGHPLLRGAPLAVALVNGMDALEEYFPLTVGQGLGGAAIAAVRLLLLVVVDSRLQERVSGRARATVTSVAALGAEVVALAVFAAWALGGSRWIAVGTVAIAVLVLRVLRRG
jgi:MFS family permease